MKGIISGLKSNASMSKPVDDISDTVNISRLFADKYHELYTSVNYDKDEM